MNSRLVSSLAALALAGATSAAMAWDSGVQYPDAPSALTRAEVRAELAELRAAHALPPVNEASPTPLEAKEIDARAAKVLGTDEDDTSVYEEAPDQLVIIAPDGSVTIFESVPDEEEEGDALDALPPGHPSID